MKQKRKIKLWLWIICIFVIVGLPFAINYILLIPAFTPLVGDNKDWLSFLSGYIGAIIGAAISLFVMYLTFTNTKRENTYKHANDWLEGFRDRCADYIEAFNINHIINIINEMTLDANKAYSLCGKQINRMMNEEVKMSLLCEEAQDQKLTQLNQELLELHLKYREIFNGVHNVVCCVRNASQKKSFDKWLTIKEISEFALSDELSNLIRSQSDNEIKIHISKLHSILLDWINDGQSIYLTISECMKHYIVEKRKEIECKYQII